jgi:hypothetical protein
MATAKELASKRVEVGGLEEAMELYYQRGWTDGLPVVPPTEEKVLQFLATVGKEPSHIISVEPVRGRVVTAEKVAINAVMAGCRPEYFPVVYAAVEGMTSPEYSLHGSSASTGGSAVLCIVNGPVRKKLGFQSGHNLFAGGPQHRANATVGRALRLFLINVLENHPGVLDRSTLGHGGKYSYCFAEDEEGSVWEPMHVEKGFAASDSTVTVGASQSPIQVQHRRVGTIEGLLDAMAHSMLAMGPGHSEIYAIFPPEHMKAVKEAGWSKAQVREYLHKNAGMLAQHWADVNLDEVPPKGREEDMVRVMRSAEGIRLVSGGGTGGSSAAVISRWSKGATAASVTKKVDTSRIM